MTYAKPTPCEQARGRYDALNNLRKAKVVELNEEEEKYIAEYEKKHRLKSSLPGSPVSSFKKKKV